MLSGFHMSVWFYFSLLICVHLCNETEKCQLLKSLKYFSILQPMRNNVRFEYVTWIPEVFPNVQGVISFHVHCLGSLYVWVLNKSTG